MSLLEVKDIYYRAKGKEILKNVSFKVNKGEIFCIIGVNGTGKTTLAAIIMGLAGFRPNKGKIIFRNREITRLSLTKRAKMGLTLAWQIPASFEGIKVKEYLSLNPNNFFSPKESLKLVGLNPNSYLERYLDESLSGGERKKIELASVFSLKPKLVILDEPDSGIDISSIRVIKRLIKKFKEMGTAIILITHSEAMAKISDKVAILCNGHIVKKGRNKEITRFFQKYCRLCAHKQKIKEKFQNEQ